MNISNETECLPQTLLPALGFAAVCILQATLNGFVSVAVMINRKKLKNNSVYVYVLSMLAANVVFGIFSAYTALSFAFGFEGTWTSNSTYRVDQSIRGHQTILTWWGFRTAMTLCMYLVMSANISAVMYGLRKSSYFAGPVVMPQTRGAKERSTTPRNKFNKAVILTMLTWLIPVILATIVTFVWNCLDKCVCFDGRYQLKFACHQINANMECSRMFNTMRNDFMIFVVVVWFFLAMVIGIMLFTTVQKYKRATNVKNVTQINAISADLSDNNDTLDTETPFAPNYQESFDDIQNNKNIKEPLEHSVEDEAKETTSGCWSQVTQLGYTVKAMILISVLFILCLLPAMIVILIDSISVEIVTRTYHTIIVFTGVMVYCISCPLILVYYMPGLRRSVSSVFYKCNCCTITTVIRGSKVHHQPNRK